jgi:co-chaperonin GroES (HSP10)
MDLASGSRVPANQAERIALINIERRRGEIAAERYKKGGMVKPKAAPKKMMKGGVVAKPKVAAKKGKPMPAFKKGGKVAMKGKK